MFVDEASYIFQSPIVSDILVEIRKYKCSFVAATQLWAQIAQDVRPAVLGSTGIRIIGKLGHDEATYLARDMETTVETIKSLKAIPRRHAQWCYYVRSVTDQGAVVVTAPYGVLEGMRKTTRSLEPMPVLASPPSEPRAPPHPLQPLLTRMAPRPRLEPHPASPHFEIKPGKDWETEQKL
jgi:hypothetical protein